MRHRIIAPLVILAVAFAACVHAQQRNPVPATALWVYDSKTDTAEVPAKLNKTQTALLTATHTVNFIMAADPITGVTSMLAMTDAMVPNTLTLSSIIGPTDISGATTSVPGVVIHNANTGTSGAGNVQLIDGVATRDFSGDLDANHAILEVPKPASLGAGTTTHVAWPVLSGGGTMGVTTGSLTDGNIAAFDSSGRVVDAGITAADATAIPTLDQVATSGATTDVQITTTGGLIASNADDTGNPPLYPSVKMPAFSGGLSEQIAIDIQSSPIGELEPTRGYRFWNELHDQQDEQYINVYPPWLSNTGGGETILTGRLTLTAKSQTAPADGGIAYFDTDIDSMPRMLHASAAGTSGQSLLSGGAGSPTWGTPALASTVTTADAGGDTTTFPMLATDATGSLAPATDAGLSYNANTNVLTVSGSVAANVTGNLTGNVTGDTSGNAGTVTFADSGGDTTMFLALGTEATGNLSPRTDAGLTVNAATNAITATTFIGALTGTASTAASTTALYSNVSAVGNDANTSEKDLHSTTIPANTLTADGDSIKFRTRATIITDLATTSTYRIKVAGTTVLVNTEALLDLTDSVLCEVTVLRMTSSTADVTAEQVGSTTAGVTGAQMEPTSLSGLDFTAAITVKDTGQNDGSSANAVSSKSFILYPPVKAP